jgi:methanogenic corrinoid protein MtbC1
MNDAFRSGRHLSIASVERETGIGKDTLRVWERRYGFPTPGRDAFGERSYPQDQVDLLRVVKRLIDAGHRPGRILRLEPSQIIALANTVASDMAFPTGGHAASRRPEGRIGEPGMAPEAEVSMLTPFLDMIRRHDAPALRQALGGALARMGAERFVSELVAPLNVAVGEAWSRGRLEVFEEHSYTEEVQVVMRHAIAQMPAPQAGSRPRVLLSTFPGEPHGLGLLMVEIICRLEGAPCVSLGVQTPVLDLVRAAQAHGVDIVAVSTSGIQPVQQLIDALTELRARLPEPVALWVGGNTLALRRRPVPGSEIMPSLQDLADALRRWREAAAGSC